MIDSNSALPKALFFDLDGTLFDSLPGISFSIEQAFATCNLPMQSIDLAEEIGPPIRKILSLASGDVAESDLDHLEAAFRTSYDTAGWQKTLLFAGSKSLLSEARTVGIQLFVISNKPRHISIRILEREGLLSHFSAVFTRDSSDPPFIGKAQMIEHVLNHFQICASRSVMVGDTAEDAHAAAAMDVPFAWVSHGYGKMPPSALVRFRIDAFSEFLPTLAKELMN